jgi:hypothetical protein
VDRDLWPSTYDRDLDLHGHTAPAPREPIDPYRRLLGNPLLAVGALVLAVALIRMSLDHRHLLLFLAATGLLFGAVFFAQFHCLDCGKTGWAVTARRHACPAVVARWREGRNSRWRVPSLRTQMIVWVYVLASVGGLMLILLASRR